MAAFVHTTAITHCIQPQQTGSAHHQHTTDTQAVGEINTSQQSDLGQLLLLLLAAYKPATCFGKQTLFVGYWSSFL